MLHIEDQPGVRVLLLDRPERSNAFNAALYKECASALEAAGGDDEVAVVVLGGRGRNFCAGQDLAELQGPSSTRMAASREFHRFVEALTELPKPIIVGVEGAAVGVGMTLLAHCDMVVVSSSARLRAPFVALGVAPEAGASSTFPRVFGWHGAADILLTGRWVLAQELVACGLAREVVDDGQATTRALAIASQIAASGPLASIMATKRLLTDGRRDRVNAARERERIAFARLFEAGVPGSTSTFGSTMTS